MDVRTSCSRQKLVSCSWMWSRSHIDCVEATEVSRSGRIVDVFESTFSAVDLASTKAVKRYERFSCVQGWKWRKW